LRQGLSRAYPETSLTSRPHGSHVTTNTKELPKPTPQGSSVGSSHDPLTRPERSQSRTRSSSTYAHLHEAEEDDGKEVTARDHDGFLSNAQGVVLASPSNASTRPDSPQSSQGSAPSTDQSGDKGLLSSKAELP